MAFTAEWLVNLTLPTNASTKPNLPNWPTLCLMETNTQTLHLTLQSSPKPPLSSSNSHSFLLLAHQHSDLNSPPLPRNPSPTTQLVNRLPCPFPSPCPTPGIPLHNLFDPPARASAAAAVGRKQMHPQNTDPDPDYFLQNRLVAGKVRSSKKPVPYGLRRNKDPDYFVLDLAVACTVYRQTKLEDEYHWRSRDLRG